MKLEPAMVLAVVKLAADPVVFWFNVGTRAAGIVPEVKRDAEWLGNLAAGTVPDDRLDAFNANNPEESEALKIVAEIFNPLKVTVDGLYKKWLLSVSISCLSYPSLPFAENVTE